MYPRVIWLHQFFVYLFIFIVNIYTFLSIFLLRIKLYCIIINLYFIKFIDKIRVKIDKNSEISNQNVSS